MLKKVLRLIIILMVLFVSQVYAIPYITNNVPDIDPNKEASLTIRFVDLESNPLANATFNVYKVASLSGKGVYTTTDKFALYDVTYDILNPADWDRQLDVLLDVIDTDSIEPDFVLTTDETGKAVKKNIDKGLYLVSSEPYILGARTYTPQSFLISVPNMLEQDIWEYDVEIFPKYEYAIDMSKIVDKTVIKMWNDRNNSGTRPTEVTIDLLKDGKVYDEVVLNESNGWTHTWEDLDDSFKWTVEEKNIAKDYVASVDYKDQVFTVTNSYIIKLPDTGQLWTPVPILFGGGLILISLGIFIGKKYEA